MFRADKVCVMEPREIEAVVERVKTMLGSEYPILPGTSFGPFSGRIFGPALSFLFNRRFKLILSSAYDRLKEIGALSIGATPARVLNTKRVPVDYLELHLIPRARLRVPKMDRPGARVCKICGFDSRALPDPLVIERSSIPDDEQLFQLVEAPEVKLAKPTFVDAVRSLGLESLEFVPVSVGT